MKQLLIVLLFLTSCKKDEVKPQETVKQDTYYLDFQTAGVNISDLPATSIETLDNNGDVGNLITFTAPDFIVAFCRLYSGEVIQITGAINGHSFIAINGHLNICNGNQYQSFVYELKR